ncbi:MAG TPA: hypothetical protein PK016_05225 [Candidatus Atribacteria bacterium]|nr:hypothetical protein [Candidatus Atribacteria bacterium]
MNVVEILKKRWQNFERRWKRDKEIRIWACLLALSFWFFLWSERL